MRIALSCYDEEHGHDHPAERKQVERFLAGKRHVRGRVRSYEARAATGLDRRAVQLMAAGDCIGVSLNAGPYAIRVVWMLAYEAPGLAAADTPLWFGPAQWVKRP